MTSSAPMFSETYLAEVGDIADFISGYDIERLVEALSNLDGRLYIIGLGGSHANAVHMAADLRKLCEIDASAPNVPEMLAWGNDSDSGSLFRGHLQQMTSRDALMVLSVGGGTEDVSVPINQALALAKVRGAKIYGIVGPVGGFTFLKGDIVIRIPVSNQQRITPHTEAFQAVIWHCLVSHPKLQKRATKW